MRPPKNLRSFKENESGGILVFWAMVLVVILGLVGTIFDLGRMATTQSELQSFADSVSLAAAAELDGQSDSITRARNAANTLISDSQTYADEANALIASEIVTLTFYEPSSDGSFSREPIYLTTNPYRARYAAVKVAEHTVSPGFAAAFAALTGHSVLDGKTAARAAAGFSLEACNVAPAAVCLPTVDFDVQANIGTTLELHTAVNVGQLLPGNIAVVDTLTDVLDGLEICAGLLGSQLDACLLAARQPETACMGRGGLELSVDVSGSELLNSLNTRFGEFAGLVSGLAGNPDFSAGPNVLTGLTNALGLCLPLGLGGSGDGIGFPADDCIENGGCTISGNGDWSEGREDYVEAHYNGEDPFPELTTRFDFYNAEIEASLSGDSILETGNILGGVLGLLGNVIGGVNEAMCVPQQNKDPKRRLMVVAGIDCTGGINAAVSAPPVQQFFEVFTLGPGSGGLLQVEIAACLGGTCGEGNLETEVRDVVRLVE